jgi:hypothetical protein
MTYLRELVATPRPLPAPFGLVNPKTLVGLRGHWENGIAYEITTGGLFAHVHDACDYTATGGNTIGNPPGSAGSANTVYAQDFAPFVIEGTDGCRSSLGLTVEERMARAVEALELLTPKAVEREFWSNGFTGVNTAGNRSLQNSTTTTLLAGAAVKPRRAIAALEQALADDGAGTLGAVHVTRDVLSLLRVDMADTGDSDGVIYTPGGNMLIGGVGYTGNGPAGANQARTAGHAWAYATGPVAVHLGPIQVSDEPSKVTGPVGVESFHTTNTLVYTAERFAAVTYNGTSVYAVLIDLDA